MCRTAHAVISTVICGIQMLVRVFMTIILMVENLIRMILQTFYNFISFLLQMLSLIPICVVFLITARLKCFMCGGGGPCPVNRGGACDCLMSAAALILLFFIFRATGVLDKIFYKIGYIQAPPIPVSRFVPTPGDITECSRNDSYTEEETTSTTEMTTFPTELFRDIDYSTAVETKEATSTLRFFETEVDSTITTDTTTTTTTTRQSKVKKHLRSNTLLKTPVKDTRARSKNSMARSTTKRRTPLTIAPMTEHPHKPTLIPYPSDGPDLNTVPTNLTTVIYYLV